MRLGHISILQFQSIMEESVRDRGMLALPLAPIAVSLAMVGAPSGRELFCAG